MNWLQRLLIILLRVLAFVWLFYGAISAIAVLHRMVMHNNGFGYVSPDAPDAFDVAEDFVIGLLLAAFSTPIGKWLGKAFGEGRP